MSSGSGRSRRQQVAAIRALLRELSSQLSLLNREVGSQVQLKDGDLACLEMISRAGPMSPTQLAQRSRLHPATVTGVLDRLERGGWIARERDPRASDRRAVAVRALPSAGAALFGLYSEMNESLADICSGYSDADLELLTDFLRRTTDAGRRATENLRLRTGAQADFGDSAADGPART